MNNNVRFYREKNNLTQAELADKSGLSLRTVQRVENGGTLKGFTLDALSEALTIDRENLLAETIDMERVKLINLATLSFFIIPFGNILLPAYLTYKGTNQQTKVWGKQLLTVQIIWSCVLSLVLILSPFVQQFLPAKIPLIILVLVVFMGANVFLVFKNALQLSHNSELYMKLKISLL